MYIESYRLATIAPFSLSSCRRYRAQPHATLTLDGQPDEWYILKYMILKFAPYSGINCNIIILTPAHNFSFFLSFSLEFILGRHSGCGFLIDRLLFTIWQIVPTWKPSILLSYSILRIRYIVRWMDMYSRSADRLGMLSYLFHRVHMEMISREQHGAFLFSVLTSKSKHQL